MSHVMLSQNPLELALRTHETLSFTAKLCLQLLQLVAHESQLRVETSILGRQRANVAMWHAVVHAPRTHQLVDQVLQARLIVPRK
jgi:hypothetical protein